MSAFAPKGSAYGRQFPAYNCVVSRDQFIRRVAQHVSMVGITKRNKGMPHRYAVGTYGTKVESEAKVPTPRATVPMVPSIVY